jgi:mRNA interferase HigB
LAYSQFYWVRQLYIREVFSACVHRNAKDLSEAMERHPDAAKEIEAWVGIVERLRWHNFHGVRVAAYVIFDIRRNRSRLITVIHYAKTTKEMRTKGHVYVRSFLTHKEYNNRSNWDRKFGTK